MKIILLFFVAIFTITLLVKISSKIRTKASFSGPTLSIMPASKEASLQETFSLEMIIDTNEDTVSAVDLHLNYDTTAFQIISFKVGTFLPVVLVPEKHENGSLTVTLGSQPDAPFKGSGIIGTLEVKATAAKQSSVSFDSDTQIAAIGKSNNVLGTTSESLIIITSADVTPTPTLEIGPTPTSYVISSLQIPADNLIPTDDTPVIEPSNPTPFPTITEEPMPTSTLTITENPALDESIPTDTPILLASSSPPTPTEAVPIPTENEKPTILQILGDLWRNFIELIF